MVPLGRREDHTSVAAMAAARTKATVVKKPKTFWMRTKVLCMVGRWTAQKRARLSLYRLKVRGLVLLPAH